MALSQDIKERIFCAADELHAASPTGEFPSVEAVRQSSRAGMNNVVEAMKEWRQNQRKQVQAVREPLPVELQGVVKSMGQSLWETAQQLANESLEAAKVAFETEKSDLIQLSSEQSDAYEKQAGELEAAQARMTGLERQAEVATTTAQATALQLEDVRRALLVAEQKTGIAEQKAQEVERRAADLRAELDHAHAEADRLRLERDKAQERSEQATRQGERAEARTEQLRETLAAQSEKADGTIEQLRGELATVKARAEAADQLHQAQLKIASQEAHRVTERITQAQTERDDAVMAAAEARERAAGLAGKLESMQTQATSLMQALATRQDAPQAIKPVKATKAAVSK